MIQCAATHQIVESDRTIQLTFFLAAYCSAAASPTLAEIVAVRESICRGLRAKSNVLAGES
jgi:hypothetical protein